ncbi:MAG: UDP-N-acetylmuramate--L-alanine ligase [Gammaproteobacteria bacterium]|nr:UDP-N-acetylmuramate--L-alanine ligase [Gammaproteobacteria bacterium]
MGRVRHVHLVGIGGAGMSGIAEVLHNLGYEVSGSDIRESAVTRRLLDLGIKVISGHDARHVNGSDVIVVSSAIASDNPELLAARRQRIPVIPRAEMLAELMRFRQGIAVAGTHGKTTTTSLIASLLAEGGLDPTYVIGGQLNSSGTHAKLGSGHYLVAEADESDASFLHLQPIMAVVTNIDSDHLGTYGGELSSLRNAFSEFLHNLPFYGLAVVCADDAGVREILPGISKPVVTYGVDQATDFQGSSLVPSGAQTRFAVSRRGKADWLKVTLNLPGRHNVLNALAAIAVASELGVAEKYLLSGLRSFQGIRRRCEVQGEIRIGNARVTIIHDYAHHPTEIAAILDAVRSAWPGRRIVTVFQPHRYTRTFDLFDDFCNVLSGLDVLVVLDVYAAGEALIAGADSRSLCRGIRSRGRVEPIFVERRDELQVLLASMVSDQDVLLLLGAGDIGSLGGELVSKFTH